MLFPTLNLIVISAKAFDFETQKRCLEKGVTILFNVLKTETVKA